MNPIHRWLKFNLVGLIGSIVQLAALAFFNRLLHGHYLIASSLALEVTLLHNFVWHLHYTWSDRSDQAPVVIQCIRFHLSNGLVSLFGNLLLMHILVQQEHLPMLLANLIAIVLCGLLNFALGHRWVFMPLTKKRQRLIGPATCLLVLLPLAVRAQTLPEAPKAKPAAEEYAIDSAYINRFAGPLVTAGGDATHASLVAGISIGMYSAAPLGARPHVMPQFEFALLGPIPGGAPLDGLFSFNEAIAAKVPHRTAFAFLSGGYSRMFATGNAVNFGLGVDFGKDVNASLIRVEVRDYYLFTGPQQHVIGLRVGFTKFVAD